MGNLSVWFETFAFMAAGVLRLTEPRSFGCGCAAPSSGVFVAFVVFLAARKAVSRCACHRSP